MKNRYEYRWRWMWEEELELIPENNEHGNEEYKSMNQIWDGDDEKIKNE